MGLCPLPYITRSVQAMSRSAISPSRSPPTSKSACDYRDPLEHLANAKHGRYVLSRTAVFCYSADEWRARITCGKSVSYTITRKPGRAGRYLTAAWGLHTNNFRHHRYRNSRGPTFGPTVRSSAWISTTVISPCEAWTRTAIRSAYQNASASTSAGPAARRDAQVRHAITRLIHYTDAPRYRHPCGGGPRLRRRAHRGRETMGRGSRGKCFRKTVAGIPIAVFRNRLLRKAHRRGIQLVRGQSRLHQRVGRSALAHAV